MLAVVYMCLVVVDFDSCCWNSSAASNLQSQIRHTHPAPCQETPTSETASSTRRATSGTPRPPRPGLGLDITKGQPTRTGTTIPRTKDRSPTVQQQRSRPRRRRNHARRPCKRKTQPSQPRCMETSRQREPRSMQKFRPRRRRY